jgi:hypothetical protein
MKSLILTTLFLIFNNIGYSQIKESLYPDFINQSLVTITSNKNWKVLTKVDGDLNNDQLNDKVIVLESKDSILEKRCDKCKSSLNKARILLILIKKNGSHKVEIQNNKFIARSNEGGMAPYLEPELSIEEGNLNIFYQYTRSQQSYSFKMIKTKMTIINAMSISTHAATGDFEHDFYDFLKNKIISKKGNISNDKETIEIINFNSSAKPLSEFKEMYEWEITSNKFI